MITICIYIQVMYYWFQMIINYLNIVVRATLKITKSVKRSCKYRLKL